MTDGDGGDSQSSPLTVSRATWPLLSHQYYSKVTVLFIGIIRYCASYKSVHPPWLSLGLKTCHTIITSQWS